MSIMRHGCAVRLPLVPGQSSRNLQSHSNCRVMHMTSTRHEGKLRLTQHASSVVRGLLHQLERRPHVESTHHSMNSSYDWGDNGCSSSAQEYVGYCHTRLLPINIEAVWLATPCAAEPQPFANPGIARRLSQTLHMPKELWVSES